MRTNIVIDDELMKGTMPNPTFQIAAAVVVPTVCAASRHFRDPGKARRIWAAASCGVPPKRTDDHHGSRFNFLIIHITLFYAE